MDLRRRQQVALAAVATAATGVLLVVEAFRAFAPSILFVYADAGSTPAEQMGLFALIPFAAAFLVPPVARRVGVCRVALAAATLLVLARILLQATSGGGPQLIAATVMTFAAFTWLVTVAGGALPRRAAAFGFVAGLGLDVALQGGLRTVGLVWQPGVVGWTGTFVVLAVFSVGTWGARQIAPSSGPAWPWVAIGPVLALHAIVGTHGRLASVTDLTPIAVLVVLGGAHVLAVAAVLLVRREPSRLGGVVTAGLVLLGLYATVAPPMAFDTTPVMAGGQALLTVGLGLTVATVGWAAGRRGPLGRGFAAAGGLLLMFVVVFGYYAGYDIRLPFDGTVLLWVGAGAVALLAIAPRPSGPVPGGGWFGPALTVAVAVAVLVATAAVASQDVPTTTVRGDGYPVRVMTYNVRMGYDIDGAVSLERLAEVIRSQEPDIVALNEIDRGWLTTGSIDVLPVLADAVGLPYVFAPAADEVWGNALLSRHPISDARVDPLFRGDTAMRRSALSAVVDIGRADGRGDGDRSLGVVVTHLHHVGDEPEPRLRQAERVATIARELRVSGFPVVVMGDMNAEPGAEEMRPLEDTLTNVTVPVGPPDHHGEDDARTPTFPSSDPVEAIDHIYVSSPLTASDLVVPESTASDHLGVAVTIDLQG